MKKLIALSMSVCLAGGLLAGCWGADSSSSTSSKPSTSSSSMATDSSQFDPATQDSSSMSSALSEGKDNLSDAVSDAGDGVSDAVSDAGKGVSDVMSGAGDAVSGAMSGAGSAVSDLTDGTSRAAAANAAVSDEDGWMLRIVSPSNPLPEDFSVRTAPIEGYDARSFDMRAADALTQMLHDAEQAGTPLYLVSAYRTIGRQRALFERKAAAFEAEGLPRDEAERQAAQWVARPGESEHNLGLAADIVSADWYASHDDLTADFANTPAYAWLVEHCAEYGFILRYPQGKEAVTGIAYEPWHFRYVGTAAARAIMDGGLTLEEYVAAQA